MTTTITTRIVIEHNDTCKKLAAERAAFEQQYPGFCKKCGGQGAWTSSYATYFEPAEIETCEECIAQGICPRCGERGLSEEGDGPCTRCGFSFDYVPAKECICWEEQCGEDQDRDGAWGTEDTAYSLQDEDLRSESEQEWRAEPDSGTYEPIKTRADVEMLKASWRGDPCWDIYDTEGYEAYEAELREYQAQMEAQWKREQIERVARKAEELGVPGNTKLAEYVMQIELRLAVLERVAAGE